jgi:phosphatidylglycerol:prolipoprotein diacylglycerol transferase
MHPLIPWFTPPAFSLGQIPGLGPLLSGLLPAVAKLEVHGFGVLVAAGFLFGSNIAQKRAIAFTGDSTAGERINQLVTWLIFGTFIGGHLGHVLWYEPQMIAKDPWSLLRVWEGLSSTGGFSVCIPLTIWYFRKEKKPFWPYADALSIGLSFGWFLGRMGCFSAHDHPGLQTNFWLGVYGICPPGDNANPTVACHDMGLYEGLWLLFMHGTMLLLARKPRFSGFYVGLMAAMYAPYRIASDFFRSQDGIDVRYFGLTPAQYGALIVLGIGVWILYTRSRAGQPAAAERDQRSAISDQPGPSSG